jgi:hypothetical protein
MPPLKKADIKKGGHPPKTRLPTFDLADSRLGCMGGGQLAFGWVDDYWHLKIRRSLVERWTIAYWRGKGRGNGR